MPWQIPHVRLRYSQPRTGVATGAWRAPAHVANAFAVETLLDEIAQITGRSPVDLRLELYGAASALRITGEDPDALQPRPHGGRAAPGRRPRRVRPTSRPRAACAGWPRTTRSAPTARRWWSSRSTPARAGAATGAARREPRGACAIHRVTCALDCGIVVNRSGVEAQAQGGIIDGLGHAFFGEITIDRGRAVEGNFDRYRLIRNREAPAAIDVHVVPSTMRPTGFGEIAVPVIAPAVANAIAAATGTRIRRTPFARDGFSLG